jgi:hypothetical protein
MRLFLFLCSPFLSFGAAVAGVKVLHKVVPRLFARQEPLRYGIVLWWEVRRVPYNLLIGVYGFVCLLIFYWGITTSGELRPGEDAVETMALLAAPFIANACYTLGWIVESLFAPWPRFGRLLFPLGLGFSLFVISEPAILWAGVRLLQLTGVIH